MTEHPIALTMGDPAGIGPDITLAAWIRRKDERLPVFFLLGDPDVLTSRAALLGLDVPLCIIDEPDEALEAFSDSLPVMPIAVASAVEPGKPDGAAAPAILGAIEQAVDLVRGGLASAVVTNPISKAVLTRAGFAHPGHTEYLASLGAEPGETLHPVMLLSSDALKVVPVTIHMPLRSVHDVLTTELILRTIRIVHEDFRRYFGIETPRLALTGLNPHAGEDGTLGDEEERIILPAIDTARAEGIHVIGPYPADTMFHAAARENYDVALGMYHDQALIPIKTLAFETGVNATLGLPFVRTSPDHGTAFPLAGSGKAKPESLIEALRLADAMAKQAAASSAA
ncbi:4-hydroxythreonine-4-phosphate dehydrogenase [Methyloligella halotolerans]|uniref:4-hydroxythreonine-4-phosphate dehydrogenase n=1 Tax=Methyloligella halotolerans TaxID=1177755 RepID=A0A1E2S1R8_9HYPH|nr:4-hydroxythreonine-4-phosphate dehydrogenase PdxA [Methyloligella halotolerans]ODA68427.1 4-hydroxythreonine-4-phosphate dehydrogenase [Methyloligella halotolerans]